MQNKPSSKVLIVVEDKVVDFSKSVKVLSISGELFFGEGSFIVVKRSVLSSNFLVKSFCISIFCFSVSFNVVVIVDDEIVVCS